MTQTTRIAVIGAGIAGLVMARALSPYGDVHVFEKSRGVGGRMSTRYAGDFSFDHGAQFFTARDPAFQSFLQPYIADGTVAEWTGKVVTLDKQSSDYKRLWFEPHYVGAPHMNSLCKKLSDGLQLHLNTKVQPPEKNASGWILRDDKNVDLGIFDWVISTVPSKQAHDLFAAHLPADTARILADTSMTGCYALMIGLHNPWPHQWIAASVKQGPLAWVGVNSSKPQRNADKASIVVHAHNQWSQDHIDDDQAAVQSTLVQECADVIGLDIANVPYLALHRWRYAQCESAPSGEAYVDTDRNLVLTGDWCAGSRVEDIWKSATAAVKIPIMHLS